MLFSVNAFAVDEEILAANTAKVEGATAENPIATDFVVNGTFDNEVAPWQTTTGAQNKALATNQQGAFTGRFYENWNPSPYVGKMYQTIENIPNGVYELKICAFVNVFDGNCQYVYANEAKTNLTTGAPTAYSVFVEVTTNTIEVGLEQTEAKTEWMGIDNISLTYFGAEATIDDARFGSYIKAVADLRASLTAAKANVSAAVVAQIDEALAATETIEKTEEAYKAAVDQLNAVAETAKLSANQKTIIDNYYDLMESTNVYSKEGYDTFKAAADEYLAKWEEGTLTEALVNPYAVQGWRAANIYDDFLLSAFGTKDFDTDLYINTWSVEGENDGSNFKVPFFEYWTGDGNSLAATTKTATVAGLEANKAYSVTAWVRVRVKNGVSDPATGITLSVGAEGTPVSVTTGEAAGTAQMYHGTFIANGTTDAEGNLTINFNVAADNNISWLSFKNIVYKEIYEPANLDFAVGTPVDNGICTYAKDMESNGTTYSQLLTVEGWNIAVENGDARAGGLFAYGSEKWLGGAGYNVPATNPEGVAEGNALGVIGVWDAVAQYTQPATLPAGNYVITVPVYNAGAGTAAPQKNLVGFIADDGTEYLADAKSYASDKWSTITVSFTLKQQTNGVISLGYDAPGSGSGANQHLFYDRVEIKAISDAELAKVELAQVIADANAVVDAKAGVGEGLFLIPNAAYDIYVAAVASAQAVYDNADATVEEVKAAVETLVAAGDTYKSSATKPASNKRYTIKQEVSGLYMTLNESGVVIDAAPSMLKFEDAGNGAYYISDADGEYVGYDGSNNWTMSSVADKKAAWTITYIADGCYTLANLAHKAAPTKCYIATDGTEAGAACYGDKTADNANGHWIIEEVVIDMAVTMINPAGETADKIAEGDSIEFTTTIDDMVGYMMVNVLQVNDDSGESEYLASYRSAVKSEGHWNVELFSTMKFRQGNTYKFEFIAYASEDDYNQEPWDAPGSAALATDTVEVKGTLPPYTYATATLNDIKPAYGSIIESETDNVVTLTFSEPVKVVYAQNLQSAGMMMPPTVNELTPEAVEADENGLATVWTVVMPLTPGFANISFAAEDAEGRRVWGNQGEEETSYFTYEWQCTVGVPDFAVAPAGFVGGAVKTLTVTCPEIIDPYMGSIVVLNAAGEEVATVENAEKVVDESLEMWSPEWYEALATAPVTLTLSNEIAEAGTYTVKFAAGAFMIAEMYQSKTTEAKFAVVPAENLVEVNVERVVNLGYGADIVSVDLAAICEKLGISSITEASVWGVNATTLEYVADAMTKYDGWRTAEGNFTTWGNNHKVCYKYRENGEFELCTEPSNEPTLGTVYTAYWAFSTESDTVVLKTNITFVKAPEVKIEVVKTITVEKLEEANTAYSGTTTTFDVAAVTEALGIDDITKADQFIMNVTDGSLVLNTTDGWRGPNGDALGWGNPGGVCVKIQDPASGTIDYIGCYDTTYNDGDTFTAKWAFVYDGKAVVIEVVITFGINVAIEGIAAEDVLKTEYFGLNGAALNAPVKGINIVKTTLKNGKVVTTKTLVK